MNCSTPDLPVLHHLLEFAQVQVHCISDAMQPYHFLLPSFPSAFYLSQLQSLFSESGVRIRWPKYYSFSISSSDEYSGLISFRVDWFDFLAVQGTLNSLLQNYSSKASILQHFAFFMVQLSQLYVTAKKIIALTTQLFVCKVMSAF